VTRCVILSVNNLFRVNREIFVIFSDYSYDKTGHIKPPQKSLKNMKPIHNIQPPRKFSIIRISVNVTFRFVYQSTDVFHKIQYNLIELGDTGSKVRE